MAEKKINNVRVINKHDTEANWLKATGFIPKQGELIVYDKDSTYNYERFKIGDGSTVVSSLPFADANKVDKVSGKGLSTNDYTTAEKNKLAGIATGANKTVVDTAMSDTSTNPVQNKVVNSEIGAIRALVGDTKVSTQISNAISEITHPVTSVNSKTGAVTLTAFDVSAVPTSRKVNGKVLSSDITLSASDVGAAATSHGNHVPTIETANNAKFLRNDNTWQTVTPANIGAAASSHGTHVTYATATPKAAGTAAVGTSSKVAREDHVHPLQTTISGNAATATKATQDASGNVITTTYATKTEVKSVSDLVGDTAVATQIDNAIDNTITGLSISGKTITYTKGDGTTGTITTQDTNTTYSAMTGATSSAAGKAGLVPAPAAGKNTSFLRGDGTWVIPTDTTYSNATTGTAGLMSAADKTKLDGIATGANAYTHPTYTAKTGVPTANQTPAFGGTFTVTQPVSDATGHITAMNSRTITIPSTAATTSKAGLMSATDKTTLNNLSTLVGDTSVSEQIEAAQIVYVGPTQPTDPNIKVWINTAEEGTGIIPVLPRVATISLPKASWTGSASPYYQTVIINTVTSATKIDLQPTVAQITSLQNADIALMAENTNGTVKVYSFGGKPTADMTMQVLLTEVSYV